MTEYIIQKIYTIKPVLVQEEDFVTAWAVQNGGGSDTAYAFLAAKSNVVQVV
ncbi:hypothetical protein NVIE_010380 [Nitrososphaera viennensis EN76]|uniref:Uncharacterized protein n=1 Tax=Nitrososphaera viennensis EN76 TaxID=926571 RepID=A0A060HI95_9ARCH|nr:hypothetical protein NVIE_010380 [Nitrososphaera viennensis EN76]